MGSIHWLACLLARTLSNGYHRVIKYTMIDCAAASTPT